MKSIKVKSDLENLHKVIDFVNQEAHTKDIHLRLIVEEIFVNIVNYSESDFIIINIEHNADKKLILLEFIDNGVEFNPIGKEELELPDNIDEAEIGGLGIHLVKNLSDSMKYYYDGENHFIISKNVKR